MNKTCCFFWLMAMLATFQVSGQNIGVKVIVKCSDQNVSNSVQSNLETELRKKTSVTTVNSDPLYVLIANVHVLKSDDGQDIVGVVLSTIITRKFNVPGSKYEFITSVMKSFDKDQLTDKCVEIVDKFDVDYFNKDRNGTN